MKCSTESEIRSQQGKKTSPKFAGEARIPIRHYDIWETVETKHVVYEELSILGAVASFLHGAKWTIFVIQSTKTAIAVYLCDSGRSVTKSVVT